jgi:hypothetical protein
VLGLEALYLAAVLTLPRALPANVFGDALVEGAISADHEDVVVGDGAEGLIAHAMELGIERGASAGMRADAGDSSAAGDSKPCRKRCAFRFRIRTAPATPHRAR